MNSLNYIINNFDFFIVDVWGILSDGFALYPDGINFLSYLKNKKKYIVLLSNTPMLSDELKSKLNDLSISDNYYDQAITAGDVTRDYILKLKHQFKNTNLNYFHLCDEQHQILNQTSYIRTNNIEKAGFILLTGIPAGCYEDILNIGLKNNLPLICANPDISIYTQQNEEQLCAGWLARIYAARKGQVIYIGKPYPEIYEFCFAKIPNFIPEKTIAIGDTLETDIKGANEQAITSILIERRKNILPAESMNIRPNFKFQSLEIK